MKLRIIAAAAILLATTTRASTAQVLRTPPKPPCLTRDSVAASRVFAMGDRCYIEWVNALNSRDATSRDLALSSLATTGGRPAVDALRAAYDRSPDRQTRSALIKSMATTGSSEDVTFLVSQLRGPFTGNTDIWPTTQAAAISLGLLRAPAARDSLGAVLRRYGPDGFAGNAVKWALAALDRPPCADSVSADLARDLPRIALSCGPLLLPTTSIFQDASTGGTWRFVDNAWQHQSRTPGDTTKDRPVISSSITVSPDGQNALVLVSMHCGRLCAEGWTFQMRREGRIWRVIGARFDWVS